MTALTGKDKRTLMFAVKHLFSLKSLLVPKSIGDFPTKNYFEHELRLTRNRSVFLTDSGDEHFQAVIDILDQADLFDGLANYSDIGNAWRGVFEKWLSDDQKPKHAEEVVQSIAALVTQEIDDHTFVVPLFGVELDGVDIFPLGAMTILRMSLDVFDSAGVKHEHTDVPHLLELNKHYLWLKGTARGTTHVAQQRFSELATLTVGMLAITVASMHEWGAHGFRIGIVMSPEAAVGRSAWFSWNERARSLTTHYAFPSGQPFPVNTALENDGSDFIRIISRAFSIVQASKKTELEEAIARAIYWYSDAHRDPVLVMKLVKYWSCVEAFFSFDEEQITNAVSAGLASILVFGGFQFVPPSEHGAIKKQIVNLYGLRSRAVHRGSHQHTTERDVAQFSQWVAWMIINMIELAEQGYTTLKEVKEQTDRLDRLAKR